MLQRIQTVFLFLIVLCMAGMLFFNVWVGEFNGGVANLTAFYLELSGTTIPELISMPYMFIAVLALASATLAIIEITRYKNRMLQIKIGTLNSLFLAGNVVLIILLTNQIEDTYAVTSARYGISLFLPAVALIFNSIANRFIRKDEKLVRSVDRIR